jgi:hypothetical protein
MTPTLHFSPSWGFWGGRPSSDVARTVDMFHGVRKSMQWGFEALGSTIG